MKELAPHTRVYIVLVVLAGYLALGRLFLGSASLPLGRWTILLLLALTCGPLQIRMPRTLWKRRCLEDGGVSVALIFVFSGLVDLPARYAAIISMAAVASRLRFGRNGRHTLINWLFELSTANLSLLLAQEIYRGLEGRTFGATGALAVASLALFLVTGWSRAAAIALENNESVYRTWFRGFLPEAPLYPAFAICGALLNRVFVPSYLNTFILSFPVICLFYYCYEFYFGRLRAERVHAREISQIYRRTVEALVLALDAKDRGTSGHVWRVQRYALAAAREMNCSDAELKAIEVGSLLHDIGKIAVPEHLLSKPAKLTRQEFNQVAIHPQVGAEILEAVNFPFPVAELVHCHHENWDGSGYPRRLKGTEIPLTARILSVVDCFDALISNRPYRPAFAVRKALEMIEARRGTTFDPQAIDALLKVLPQFKVELKQTVDDSQPQLVLRAPRSIDAVQTSLTAEERHRGHSADPTFLPEGKGLHRIYESVGSGLHVDEILDFALSELERVTPYDGCAVFLSKGDLLMAEYSTFGRDDRWEIRVPLREGPTGWVAARAETLVNGNPAAEPGELGRAARAHAWQDSLVIPLWDRGQVIGTFNLYSKAKNTYTQDHAHYLELMTANLGIALSKVAGRRSSLVRNMDKAGVLDYVQ